MCRHSTCLATPGEAQLLRRIGYEDRLSNYYFRDFNEKPVVVTGSSPKGHEGKEFTSTRAGRCTFHTDEGKCELHNLGLKPLEGRLAHHDRDWTLVREEILKHW